MNMPVRFLLYVVVLNLARYLIGMPIEQLTIAEPMHRVMPLYPEVFNANLGSSDLIVGFVYNFCLWLAVALVFHLTHPIFSGPTIWRSLKVFGLMLFFYISLAAVYMNHYADAVKPFYLYSMVDGIIIFFVVGVVNGIIYRFFFKPQTASLHDATINPAGPSRLPRGIDSQPLEELPIPTASEAAPDPLSSAGDKGTPEAAPTSKPESPD